MRKQPNSALYPSSPLTAEDIKGDRERCLEVGASDYLAKPEQLLTYSIAGLAVSITMFQTKAVAAGQVSCQISSRMRSAGDRNSLRSRR